MSKWHLGWVSEISFPRNILIYILALENIGIFFYNVYAVTWIWQPCDDTVSRAIYSSDHAELNIALPRGFTSTQFTQFLLVS